MKGQLGEFFGFSLTLLNFGIVEGKTDAELDELVCQAKSEVQALDALKEVSMKSFDVTDKSNNKTQLLSAHQFSIPRIYAVGDSDNSSTK